MTEMQIKAKVNEMAGPKMFDHWHDNGVRSTLKQLEKMGLVKYTMPNQPRQGRGGNQHRKWYAR